MIRIIETSAGYMIQNGASLVWDYRAEEWVNIKYLVDDGNYEGVTLESLEQAEEILNQLT